MKLTILGSHAVLPASNPVEIVALVTLERGSASARTPRPLDLRFVLDRSGSMTEPSGVGQDCKLEALKKAVNGAVDLLVPGDDQISCVAFDDSMQTIVNTHVIASDIDRARIKRDIGALAAGASTVMSDAFRHAVDIASIRPNAARRAVVFTDGHVNNGDDVRCRAIADHARERRMPLAVFAVGVNYDETFLRDLAARAGLGSYFAHVSDVDEVRIALGDEIAQLRSVHETDLEIALRPGAGVSILEVSRLVPQQITVAADAAGATDSLAALDARGQKYLVKCRLSGGRAGVHTVLSVDVGYRVGTLDERTTGELHLELTSDASRWSQANGAVLATVVNAAAVRAVTSGNVPLAKTLFTRAGNAAMLQQLTVLGSAAASAPGGNAGRALRTIVSQQAHLPTLGSAPPAGGKP